MKNCTNTKPEILAWLLTLETARAENNFERAAEALRELRRLGVSVKYSAPRAGRATEMGEQQCAK